LSSSSAAAAVLEPPEDLWASLLPPPAAEATGPADFDPLDPDTQDALFEELARRLDQAAAEMGIDVEE
jgi:hypothetical protein